MRSSGPTRRRSLSFKRVATSCPVKARCSVRISLSSPLALRRPRCNGGSERVHEHGKDVARNLRAGDAERREDGGPELFPQGAPAQRLDYVPPQPDRVVVLLVERDPG